MMHSSGRVRFRLAMIAVLAVTLAAAQPVTQPPAEKRAPTASNREKRGRVAIGALLLGLVVVSGLGMLGVVLMLGRRTRLLARQPLPECSPSDDLWFLRKPRNRPVARDTPVEEREPPPA